MIKKTALILSVALGVASFAFADLTPQITIDPISPVFNLNKNEVQKMISVYNISQNMLVCTPTISNDPMFVNPKSYLGDSLFVFPKQFQLAPGASATFELYVYNTDKLVGDGEFDAILNVKTRSVNAQNQSKSFNGASFLLVQQGVVELFKGVLTQNLSLTNLSLQNNVVQQTSIQSGSSTVSNKTGGSSVTVTVDNAGNVHTVYKIDYVFYDNAGKRVDSGTSDGVVVRNTNTQIVINSKVRLVSKAVLTLTYQDIETKKFNTGKVYVVNLSNKS